MTTISIRDVKSTDRDNVLMVADACGLFTEDELPALAEVLDGYLSGEAPDDRWVLIESDDVAGAAYFAPEPFADRLWNLYFIAMMPDRKGGGFGTRLVDYIEGELRSVGAQTLIVETSSTPTYEATRGFYAQRGFVREATIRDWYGPGDDKVVFWKSLADSQ